MTYDSTFVLIFKVGFAIFLRLQSSHTSSNAKPHIWMTADNHIPFNLQMYCPGSSLAGVACHTQRETRQRALAQGCYVGLTVGGRGGAEIM